MQVRLGDVVMIALATVLASHAWAQSARPGDQAQIPRSGSSRRPPSISDRSL